MSNNPVTLLMHEHEVIQKVQTVAAKLDGLWENNSALFKTSLENILRFLKEYSDNYHHQKEEQVLFPSLEENPSFTLDTIITELHEHHDNFREYASEISDFLNAGEFKKSYEILKKYFGELLDHIAIENDELFIMAENLFEPGELESMYFRFLDIDRDLGEDKKSAFERFPDELDKSLAL